MDPDYKYLLGLAVLIGVVIIRQWYMRRKHARINAAFGEAMDALKRGDWAVVRKNMEDCIAHYPHASGARRMLARALTGQGDLVRAEEELKLAVAFEPREPQHLAELALFQIRYTEEASGLKLLEEAFQLNPALREELQQNNNLSPEIRAKIFGT